MHGIAWSLVQQTFLVLNSEIYLRGHTTVLSASASVSWPLPRDHHALNKPEAKVK